MNSDSTKTTFCGITKSRITTNRSRTPHIGNGSTTRSAATASNWELRVSDAGVIEQAWFTGTGCVISQASASMLVERIEGQAVETLANFAAQDMLRLFRARLTPLRQRCCLLSWEALRQLLEKD